MASRGVLGAGLRWIGLAAMGTALPVLAQSPQLVPAALRAVTPAVVSPGSSSLWHFDGVNLASTREVIFDDPAVTAQPGSAASRNRWSARIEVGSAARPGLHRAFLRTGQGVTGSVTFWVNRFPETVEQEPNDQVGQATSFQFGSTLSGVLSKAVDVDSFVTEVPSGQELVCEVVTSAIRSRLAARVEVLGANGRKLHEQVITDSDPLVIPPGASGGRFVVRISDLENASGGDVIYRISAGAMAVATGAEPRVVHRAGETVRLTGPNIPSGTMATTPTTLPAPGSLVSLSTSLGLVRPAQVVVGSETSGSLPQIWSGRIGSTPPREFSARKGEQVVVEVLARRFGSTLDSVVDVLDAAGKPIERAALRCVSETITTLNDRDSAATGLRLVSWSDLVLNDLLYVRGEVIQLVALPRGPDDDARFRSVRGQRIGLLDTTPIAQALGTPVYKVQVHPPGSRFAPNGMPVFRLPYLNDDGGPGYGKDSFLTFTAPADGKYQVRVRDARGGGAGLEFVAAVRRARPAFTLALATDTVNVPAGSRVPVEVMADRREGLMAPIQLHVEALPAGWTATTTTIEAGETSATILLTAGSSGTGMGSLLIRGFVEGDETVAPVRLEIPAARIGVQPEADLNVRTTASSLELKPGEEGWVEVEIDRRHGFVGRVPVELRNLPFGVRVQDVGLNGVLITENERARRFQVFCEPWVRPQRRVIYCTVRTETESPGSTEVGAVPIELKIMGTEAPRLPSR